MIDRNVRRCFGVHQPTLPESPARQERGENRQPDNPRSCRPRQINDRSQENKGNPSSSNQLIWSIGIRQTGASAFVVPLGTHHLINQPLPPERAQMLCLPIQGEGENDRRLKRRAHVRPPVVRQSPASVNVSCECKCLLIMLVFGQSNDHGRHSPIWFWSEFSHEFEGGKKGIQLVRSFEDEFKGQKRLGMHFQSDDHGCHRKSISSNKRWSKSKTFEDELSKSDFFLVY